MEELDENWIQVGECDLLEGLEPKVGLFTHGGPDSLERWAQFCNFIIFGLKS